MTSSGSNHSLEQGIWWDAWRKTANVKDVINSAISHWGAENSCLDPNGICGVTRGAIPPDTCVNCSQNLRIDGLR